MHDLRHIDSVDLQAEARDQEIIGKDDRVTRLKYPGSDQHPGGLNISLSTPLSRLEMTLVKCQETAADDDTLLLSAVVSRARPGGSETMRTPSSRTEGLSKQDVKAEDVPVPASGGLGNIDDVILLLSDDDEGDQRPLDVPKSGSDAEAASGGRSSANNGVTPAGSLQAPPPTTKMSAPSLSTAVREGTRRAAAITTGTHGDDRSPGDSGRQNLRRSMRRKTALMMKHKETAGDDVPHVSSVVSSAHPEGSDEMMRLRLRAEGLSQQGVKAEDTPMPTINAIHLLCDDDDDHGIQEYSRNDCDEEAASGGTSSANRGTPDGITAAPPPPPPAATSSSLSRAVRKVIRRAATSTRKRKQPETGEKGGPSYAGREHLRRAAQSNKGKTTAKNLPLTEESQTRQQKNRTRDTTGQARNRCECGSRQPSFGIPGTIGRKAARWCSQCPSKPNNAVDVRNKRCECGSCHPTFGLPETSGWKAARWCLQCPSKPNNAVDVVNKRCECGHRQPTFGLPGTIGKRAAIWCSQCPSKPHNAVDVVNKRCECGSCHPTFGLPETSGWKAAQWCSQCPSKPHNAVDVRNKRCECGRHRPIFGLPWVRGMKAARWCSQCPSKPNNAVDVVHKRCECGRRHPSFGLPGASGWKAARWCSQCPSKPRNAVDMKTKWCECGSCHPSFGLPGASGRKAAQWCSQCPSKLHNAVNVVNKRCECGIRQPSFGIPGVGGMKGTRRWCSQCPSKPSNAVDVKSSKR